MKTFGVTEMMGIRDGFKVSGLVLLLWSVWVAMPLHASSLHPLEIAIVMSKPLQDQYFEPTDRRIVIRSRPVSLFIRIRNTSDSSRLVRVNPEKAYSIELKDEAGGTTVVKRKKAGLQSGDDVRTQLPPGAERIFPIEIDPALWDGVPDLKGGQERKMTARIVYEATDGSHLYSEFYTLIFNITE